VPGRTRCTRPPRHRQRAHDASGCSLMACFVGVAVAVLAGASPHRKHGWPPSGESNLATGLEAVPLVHRTTTFAGGLQICQHLSTERGWLWGVWPAGGAERPDRECRVDGPAAHAFVAGNQEPRPSDSERLAWAGRPWSAPAGHRRGRRRERAAVSRRVMLIVASPATAPGQTSDGLATTGAVIALHGCRPSCLRGNHVRAGT
jgi:hypothetical protein